MQLNKSKHRSLYLQGNAAPVQVGKEWEGEYTCAMSRNQQQVLVVIGQRFIRAVLPHVWAAQTRDKKKCPHKESG